MMLYYIAYNLSMQLDGCLDVKSMLLCFCYTVHCFSFLTLLSAIIMLL